MVWAECRSICSIVGFGYAHGQVLNCFGLLFDDVPELQLVVFVALPAVGCTNVALGLPAIGQWRRCCMHTSTVTTAFNPLAFPARLPNTKPALL